MEEEGKIQVTTDQIQEAQKVWNDPEKMMRLIDLLFLWEDPDKKKICS